MNQANKIEYILYARKSSEDKSKQIQSIESQIQVMKDYAAKNNLTIVEVMHEEKSGKTPGIRAVFANMIKLIEAGKANGILVWKLDRIARNLLEGGRIIDMLQNGIIQQIQTPEETHRPTDNVYSIAIQLCGANQYSRDLSTNVKRGFDTKYQKGWRPGSAPQGYLNSKFKDRGDNDISIDPERFKLVRKIWDLMLTGNYTAPQVLDIANDQWGYKTRKTKMGGDKPMGRSSIYRILTNLFYAGIIERHGVQYPGKHEKMITLDEFDKVQIILGREGKPRPKTHIFPFTGIIHCAECGCMITAADKFKMIKNKSELKKHTYYYCTRRRKNTKCNQKEYITKETLELQIEKELEKYELLPEFLKWALEKIREKKGTDLEDKVKIREMQEKTLGKTEAELEELTRMRYKQMVSDEMFLNEKADLEKKIAQLKGKLKKSDSSKEEVKDLKEKTFKFATYARKAFIEGRWEPQKELLTTLAKNPIIRGKKLVIEPFEWFEPIEKGYPALQQEYLRWEPSKNGDFPNKFEKIEALASISTRWRGQGDLNPRSPP